VTKEKVWSGSKKRNAMTGAQESDKVEWCTRHKGMLLVRSERIRDGRLFVRA